MAKKIKHGAQRPPLSGIDKFLYTLLILICAGLFLFSSFYMGMILPDNLHNYKSDVIWSSYWASYFCSLPLDFLWVVIGFPISAGKKRRVPILGNPKFKPKMFSPTVKVYPIVSPQYKENFTNSERKGLKVFAIVISILTPLSLLIYPMGIYPRDVYLDSDTIVSYNMFNQETFRGHISSAESLEIGTFTTRKSHNTFVDLTIVFEEECYTFNFNSKESLEKALYIKSHFAHEQIKITSRSTAITRLISQMKSEDPETIPLIYELYDYTP